MLRNLLCASAALLLLTGCPEPGTIRESQQVNRWIYEQMQRNYLWSSELPPEEEVQFNTHPETFFNRLKYRVDNDIYLSDGYSEIYYIGDDEYYPAKEEDTEYGSDTQAYHFGMEISKAYSGGIEYCQVIYVVSGSPADRAGLRRGDCFTRMGDAAVEGMDIQSVKSYLDNAVSVRLEVIHPEEKTVTMRKQYYADNPVHFDTVFELTPATGYLVYNHFTDGSADTWYRQLQQVFARFRQAGVENIIVDLRYNGGGELDAARKMCSLLAPPDALGGVYLYKEYNSSYGQPAGFTPESLYSAAELGSYNCGDISLYIITGSSTASASELIVHCLRPLYDRAGLRFMQVGQKTEGKNVGGQIFSNDRYEWVLNLITLRVYNIDKVSGYEEGLVPDYSLQEVEAGDLVLTPSGDWVIDLAQWGDAASDRLLKACMDDIYGYGGWSAFAPGDGQSAELLDSPSRAAAVGAPFGMQTSVKSRPLIDSRGVNPERR